MGAKSGSNWRVYPCADALVDDIVADFIDAYVKGGKLPPSLEPYCKRAKTESQRERVASLCRLFLEVSEALQTHARGL